MKYYLLALFTLIFNVTAFSQTCPENIDFENGDFSNWQCYLGTTYTKNSKNVIDLKPSKPTANRHEIIFADISNGKIPIDNYGNFPKLCSYGGKFSVKLGNEQTGAEAESISYTFTVPQQKIHTALLISKLLYFCVRQVWRKDFIQPILQNAGMEI